MGSKKKSDANKKDSQLIIRINREQRDRFTALCDDMDTSAAREVRRFIKQFIKEHDESSDS
jgi:predicted DNA-binding protein